MTFCTLVGDAAQETSAANSQWQITRLLKHSWGTWKIWSRPHGLELILIIFPTKCVESQQEVGDVNWKDALPPSNLTTTGWADRGRLSRPHVHLAHSTVQCACS